MSTPPWPACNEKIGFVFQSFELLPRSTPSKRRTPLIYARNACFAYRAVQALQRTASATACATAPTSSPAAKTAGRRHTRSSTTPAYLADEPTGNLDSRTSREISPCSASTSRARPSYGHARTDVACRATYRTHARRPHHQRPARRRRRPTATATEDSGYEIPVRHPSVLSASSSRASAWQSARSGPTRCDRFYHPGIIIGVASVLRHRRPDRPQDHHHGRPGNLRHKQGLCMARWPETGPMKTPHGCLSSSSPNN